MIPLKNRGITFYKSLIDCCVRCSGNQPSEQRNRVTFRPANEHENRWEHYNGSEGHENWLNVPAGPKSAQPELRLPTEWPVPNPDVPCVFQVRRKTSGQGPIIQSAPCPQDHWYTAVWRSCSGQGVRHGIGPCPNPWAGKRLGPGPGAEPQTKKKSRKVLTLRLSKVAVTYSPTWCSSTIGASELNFSVRNGKRWILTAISALSYISRREKTR